VIDNILRSGSLRMTRIRRESEDIILNTKLVIGEMKLESGWWNAYPKLACCSFGEHIWTLDTFDREIEHAL
jgi:hypothetical protein